MDILKSLNVLFLEDNKEFAKNTVELLEMFFNKIFHASSIKESLKLYEKNNIDIILSDIKVEDGNGLDFIKIIRADNKDIPIVVLSAHKDEDFLFKAIPLNITSYEIKPLSHDKFLILLKKLATNFEQQNQRKISNIATYNSKEKVLYFKEESIKLTKKEILFIELLLKDIDAVVTLDMIQEHVWINKPMTEAGLKNLLFRLRNKTDKNFITTLQSVGYKFG